jgi:predicted alpha/beta hydrolase
VTKDAGIAPEELTYLGHSLGGVIALAALGQGIVPTPKKLALFAVSLWLEGRGGKAYRKALFSVANTVGRALGYAPARALSVGSDDEPAAYVEELARWCRQGRWIGLDGVDYEAGIANIKTEVYAALGAGDRLCRRPDAERFLSLLPGARELRMVGRDYGDAFDPDHFSFFTRQEMQPLWDELVDFLVG